MTPLKPYLVRSLHEWILDNNFTPYLLVDTKVEFVDVPQAYISDDKIILNTHPGAIQDWYIDNEVISFNARFSGKSESMYIPVQAVLAVYAKENGKGMMFDEQLEGGLTPDPDGPKPTPKKSPPRLKVVK